MGVGRGGGPRSAQRGGAETGPRPWVSFPFDHIPVLAGGQLLGLEHLCGGGDGGQQQASLQRVVEELLFGAGGGEGGHLGLDRFEGGHGFAAVAEGHGVGHPVLVPGGLVAAAALVDVVHQPLGEGAHRGAEHVGDRHVTVRGWVHEAQENVAPLDTPTRAGHPR